MQVNMIFGFLGSGKTTLVRHLLDARARDRKLAVMLRDKAGVEHTVIEASGVADPEEMIESFSAPEFRASVAVGPFVTVVDTAKFEVMREMLGEFYGSQVAHADIVLLNKIDLASPEQLAAVRAEVAELNPGARIVTTEHCGVDAGLVLDALSGWEPSQHEGGHHHHHGHHGHHGGHPDFESEVLDAAGPVARAALESFFAGLPPEVLRAKGFMVVDGAASLVQFTAGQLEITPTTLDRVPQMVFIGRDLDRAGLAASFAFAGAAPESGMS
jgi:G3E family GTPase